MIKITRKYVVDEQGKPQEVIIPWEQFQLIAEILGLDLDEKAIADLQQAREDRAQGKKDAYIELDAL